MDEVVGGAAVTLFIVFLAALRAILRREEGEAGAFSAAAVIAGSVVAAGALVDVALEDASLRALLAFPAAALLTAASLGILTTGAMPRLIAYAGLASAALQLPAAFSVAEDVAAVAFLSWVVLAALAMLRWRGD
jgi:hypothetical protein